MHTIPLPIWRGRFPHLDAAPGSGPGFSDERWQAQCALELQRAPTAPPTPRLLTRLPSPLIAFAAGWPAQTPLRVLDIGGGLGVGYRQLRMRPDPAALIDYTIVESETLCHAGSQHFPHDPAIHFTTAIPHDAHYDLVICASSLQYISDWTGLLRTVSTIDAEWLILDDLPLQPVATYASLQRWYDSHIPCWFFGRADVTATVTQLGWTICETRIAGFFTDPTTRAACFADIPASHQPDYWWHLLCRRNA